MVGAPFTVNATRTN